MLALILLIIFSLGVAYFATQNTGVVHVLLGTVLLKDIPLYAVVIGSMLVGIFISWVISIVDTFSSAFTIHGKESEIKKMQRAINELKEENHELEIENIKLRGEVDTPSSVTAQEPELQPSFSTKIRHSIG